MASASSTFAIDIDELLRPISDDRRGGDASAYTRELRQQLNELRNPPRSANPDDPDQDGGNDSVDWSAVLRNASTALIETTKDLRIACHLVEAAMYQFGLAGLRDGLIVVRRLVEDFWNDLAPTLDPDDPETRSAPLENLLNDPTHGPRLPATLRNLALLNAGDAHLTLLSAMRQSDELTAANIASAVRQISVDDAVQLSTDLDGAIKALDALQHELIERMGDHAPAFNHLSESLFLIRRWFDSALKEQLSAHGSNDDAPLAEQSSRPTTARSATVERSTISTDSAVHVDQTIELRAETYRQLTNAANVLQRMEPHSPIPYMVHRAVQLGQMPFPRLMSQLVKEESTLEMFSRELGLTSMSLNNAGDGN